MIFFDESCKMETAHLIGAIPTNVGSCNLLQKCTGVARHNSGAEHVWLKLEIKQLQRKI